jgi:hypothetical protein
VSALAVACLTLGGGHRPPDREKSADRSVVISQCRTSRYSRAVAGWLIVATCCIAAARAQQPLTPRFRGGSALTRAQCPDGSLHGHIVKQWPYVR